MCRFSVLFIIELVPNQAIVSSCFECLLTRLVRVRSADMQSSFQRSGLLLGSLRARPHPRGYFSSRLPRNFRHGSRSVRSFSSSPPVQATHHQTPSSSLLSQALDQQRRAAGNAQADTAGPFTLGMVQQPYAQQPKVKKWSELSTKGKGSLDTDDSFRKCMAL